MLREKAEQLRVPVLRPAHLEVEIRPVKARGDLIGRLQVEQAHDVAADRLRCRRGERAQARPNGQPFDERLDLQIAGAEILPPLADAMCLVDDDLRNLRMAGKVEKQLRQQAFRRDIDDLVNAISRVLKRQHKLARRERAVKIGRAHAVLQKRADLVAHQRNQRRNDERHAREHERRDLVAERLARARGHDGHHVSPGEDRRDDLLLPRPEIVVAKDLAKRLPRRVHRRHAAPPSCLTRLRRVCAYQFIISPRAWERQA